MKVNICCICGDEFEGYGNNPDGAMWKDEMGNVVDPEFSVDDRCCDECNNRYVIPGRIYRIYHKGGDGNES